MIEFYAEIKWVHVASVMASGLLFLIRGLMVQAGRQQWALWAPVRYLSYSIDTILLTAAMMLVAILPGALFSNGWLLMKLGLLVVYIVLGSYAIKRGRSRSVRGIFLVAALVVFVFIISVARAHHPLGLLWPLLN